MAEIRLELSLERASGVLAGIVGSLAQLGLELQSQKLERDPEGRGGWLSIRARGEPPDIDTLSARLEAAPGVRRLLRVAVDGEVLLGEHRIPEDRILPEDAADRSPASGREQADSDGGSQAPPEADRHPATQPADELPWLGESGDDEGPEADQRRHPISRPAEELPWLGETGDDEDPAPAPEAKPEPEREIEAGPGPGSGPRHERTPESGSADDLPFLGAPEDEFAEPDRAQPASPAKAPPEPDEMPILSEPGGEPEPESPADPESEVDAPEAESVADHPDAESELAAALAPDSTDDEAERARTPEDAEASAGRQPGSNEEAQPEPTASARPDKEQQRRQVAAMRRRRRKRR